MVTPCQTASRRPWVTRAAGAVIAIAILIPSAGPAVAQEPTASISVTGQSVPFTELGQPADLRLATDAAPVSITVTVPDGLAARQLTGTVTTPIDFREGWLEIQSAGRTVQRVDLPGGSSEQGVPISISLEGLPVVNGTVTLSIANHYIPLDDRCYDRNDFAPLTLRDAAVTYDGVERQPTTAAEFLPPILRKITIHLSDSSSRAQQDAALSLSTSIVNHYGNHSTAVELAELPGGTSVPDLMPTLFERNIVLSGGAAGIDLAPAPSGVPTLRITGGEDELTSQTDLLIANLDNYRPTGAASTADRPVPEISQDAVSLYDLKMGSLTATGSTHIEVPIPINQTQLGRPLSALSTRLFGTYVPLPQSRNGILSVTLDGVGLTSAPLDTSGMFDVTATVPPHLLQRYMTLAVSIDVTGEFLCGSEDASSLTVDPNSTIVSELASPPLPGGFASLPQSLLPTVDVGMSTGDFADLVRAGSVLVQMQRASYLPLQPRVLPFDSVVNGTLPAVLIASNGQVPDQISQPLGSVDSPELAFRGVTEATRYGNIQVIEEPSRTVVLASSNGDPADLDALLRWLEADNARLPGLTGDVLVGPRSAEPFALDVRITEIAPQSSASVADSGIAGGTLAWLAAGTALVAAGMVTVTLWLRRRHR